MGYADDEDSGHAGAPVELFEFISPSTTWRYTSDGVAHTYDSNSYTPIAITRGDLPSDGTSDTAALVVRLPAATVVPMAFGLGDPERTLQLKVYRYHSSDDVRTIWDANVPQVSIRGRWAELRSPSLIADKLQTDAPRDAFQRQCNNHVYDERCRVTKASPLVVASTAASIGNSGYTLTVSTVGGNPDGWFDGGTVIRDSDGEGRFIITQVGSVLTLNAPFRTLTAADALTLEAGCDRSIETCRDKFSNVVNYTGHLIPSFRLFGGGTRRWRDD